jgi:hypothetical protein
VDSGDAMNDDQMEGSGELPEGVQRDGPDKKVVAWRGRDPTRPGMERRTPKEPIQKTPAQTPRPPQVSINYLWGGVQVAGNKIDNHGPTIVGVNQYSDSEEIRALQALEQAVKAQYEHDAMQQEYLLDQIKRLAEAEQLPPEKRNRHIVRLAWNTLTTAATAGTELGKAINEWGSILHGLVS